MIYPLKRYQNYAYILEEYWIFSFDTHLLYKRVKEVQQYEWRNFSIFVKNLHEMLSEKEIELMFSKVGIVRSVRKLYTTHIYFDDQNRKILEQVPTSFAYVNFENS